MNIFVETLNRWGGQFLNFTWPMLWQSSLLIAIIFLLDFALRGKIRAAIRYTLWLVVLVKLILPPTFASPTNPRWWIHSSNPPIAKIKTVPVVVTYGDSIAPQDFQLSQIQISNPPPHLSLSAFILIASSFVSLSLFVWLLIRWRRVTQQIRKAEILDDFKPLLDEIRQLAGLRSMIRLKLTEDSMSPAVCGLFRPVILLPQSLVKNLSREQLRAVLLHEAIHLRRGDVWMNCAQALLQIIYWWHPLLWLASVRIRRVREEAVDDAVMLALRDDSEIYAPTLLEVAKFAFRRPLATLGLVGILESRSALRQRIERLMDFRAPRKAGLTVVSILGILAFTAVALPMGKAPENDDLTASEIPSSPIPQSPKKALAKTVLITSRFFWVDNANLGKVISDLKLNLSGNNSSWPVSPEKINQVTGDLQAIGLSVFAAPRVVTISGETATISISKGTNGVNLTCLPTVTNNFVNLAIHSVVNENSIHSQFATNSILQNGGGIMFFGKIGSDFSKSNLLVMIGVQINPTNFFKKTQASTNSLRHRALEQRNDVEKLAEPEVIATSGKEANFWSAESVQFSSPDETENIPTNLQMRVFKVDAFFRAALRTQPDMKSNAVPLMAKDFFEKLGVNLNAPGRSIAFSDEKKLLFVKATASELDTVEHAIEALNMVAPQVHIKARFVEVPKNFVIPQMFSNVAVNPMIGILSDTNFRAVLHILQRQENTETIAEPEVVTTSGRQTQMRATQTKEILLANTSNHSFIVPQTEKFQIGPIIDLVPYVLADGYTIDLKAVPAMLTYVGDEKTDPPVFRLQETNVHIEMGDNQTLVLGNLENHFTTFTNGASRTIDPKFLDEAERKTLFADKQLLVFVTATIVDPAGNRIHSDDELLSKEMEHAIPPQPQQ